MRRTPLVLVGLLVVLGALMSEGAGRECREWQGRYKRVLFLEIMINSPVILTPELVEYRIGERPAGCHVPTRLTEAELEHYRRASE